MSLAFLTGFSAPLLALCVNPPDELIAWWVADGTPEDRVASNDGMLMGGMGFAGGLVQQGFEFDGVDDYVDAGNAATARPDFPFSVDFWVNQGAASKFTAICSTDTGGNGQYSGFGVYVNPAGAVISGIGNNQGCCTPAYRRNFYSPEGVVTLGNWHHVAVVFESATSHLIYVDGAVQPTTSAGTATTMAYGPGNLLQLGRVYDANSTFSYATGRLDEVQIQDGILDPGKIQQIYLAGSEGQCKDEPIATESRSWSAVKATFDGRGDR